MRKLIEYRTPYGTWKSVDKVFNDEKHFNNWYSKMSDLGYKIEGVYAIHPKEDPTEFYCRNLTTWQERFSY